MQRLSRIVGLGYIAICLATLAGTVLFGPLGYAPLPLVAGPARAPIVVTIWYGTEKKEWLEAARTRFEATQPVLGGHPIQIQLKGLGSGEMVDRVVQQSWGSDSPPTAVSPASSLWIELMKSDWAARSGAAPIVAAEPRQLVLTPLVLVAWENRAKALWPGGPRNFWGDLHDAIANDGGWKALGGSESWGPVKLGHTAPPASNSGAQALVLMAYGFLNKTGGLTTADVSSPQFEQWLREIERGVPAFSDSTGDFMNDMVLAGPSKYDFGIVYENLALQSMDAARNRQGQPLRIYYPPATLLSDHPYATLQAPWATPEQRVAADKFRDFLLSRPIQELALQSGFRPVDASVSIASSDPANPFNKYARNGALAGIPGQAETPSGATLRALLDLWRAKIGR